MNVDNSKLYEPSMLYRETEEKFLPTIEELTLEAQVELENIWLCRIIPKLPERGGMTFEMVLKGQLPMQGKMVL
jgi:hypothetical protein